MSPPSFDEKFGATLVERAPTAPGVYRYVGAEGAVLYVGKAKNLRRRLQSYRNASRKKAHRKMRTLVRESSSLEFEVCATEEAALLRESELIAQLAPPYNVEGAYAFLYPSIGTGTRDGQLFLCFTTQPEQFEALGLTWFGCFRSRPRAKLAFDSLVSLLSLVGHRQAVRRLPAYPRVKGSRVVGLRQIPGNIVDCLPQFLRGEDPKLPGTLARALLAKARARREAVIVQEHLRVVASFFDSDASKLRAALLAVGSAAGYVCQDERDALFIRAKFAQGS